jgi:hypothetical protein
METPCFIDVHRLPRSRRRHILYQGMPPGIIPHAPIAGYVNMAQISRARDCPSCRTRARSPQNPRPLRTLLYQGHDRHLRDAVAARPRAAIPNRHRRKPPKTPDRPAVLDIK